MKASQFKELIKEAVREVIKEEFSIPQQPVQEQAKLQPTGNAMLDILNETRASMTSEDFRNMGGDTIQSSMAQNFNRAAFIPQGRTIKPTSDDPRAVQAAVASAPKVGLDLSQLGFINKAAAIVNEADRKQKEKNGL
jgi:hypothetical protein